jgi:4-hydroxybenzoate polyprenyltransferase
MKATALLGDIASILRLHIIAIAVMAALAFSRMLVGELHVTVALLGGLDWLLINLLNRVSDVKEDIANQIRGTERLVGKHRLVLGAWVALLAASIALGHLVAPELTFVRLGVQLVGVGYSYPIVPAWHRGKLALARFKDLYFFKNFMSAALFVTTCIAYPLLVAAGAASPAAGGVAFAAGMSWDSVIALVAFFVPFEITYEILYDLRDLDGDRLAGVPTYPVVHGVETSVRIIDALLVAAAATLLLAVFRGALGLRELLMVLAPVLQVVFYKPRYRRGLTSGDCIALTWIGAGLLGVWLAGTALWVGAGLPENVFLR